jgi:CRP-like cAMP-binding protein
MNKEHQRLLEAAAQPFEARPGELLAKEGEIADRFLFIQAGHAAIGIDTRDTGFVQLQAVGRGDVIGWSWLVPPHRWQFECRAVDNVRGFSLDGCWLRKRCEEDHEFGFCLLKVLLGVVAGRLTATRRQLLGIYK